ncbi:MAG: hypothetical protein LBP68_00380 [Acidobacteriota bacterium]|jgi:hypothetical protein|nr:hypothetical protein [Acidobacteriota bacterium]
MPREMTITVDDAVYEALNPIMEQNTIGDLLNSLLRLHGAGSKPPQKIQSIRALRGTLHPVITSDLREEEDRSSI